jgi:ribose-phosphate pyrophosphokinase
MRPTENTQVEDRIVDRIFGQQTDNFFPNRAFYSSPNLKVFCGSASLMLGKQIADYIAKDPNYPNFEPGKYEKHVFSNENIFTRLKESVRGQDVYLIQTLASPVHDNIMEMFLMIDTLKLDSALRINVVIPHLSYARSDKKDQPRVGIAARLLANLIEAAGADRYITIDLHAGQIQGFFNIPGDALTGFHLLSNYVKEKYHHLKDDLIVVPIDLGFAKQGRNWATTLGVPMAIVEKRRVDNTECPEVLSVIGDIKGKHVLLVDDEVLTGGSVERVTEAVRKAGALDVLLAFTHPILSENACERLARLDFREIIFCDTVPLLPHKKLPNMTILSIAQLLAEVIIRSHEGRSVGALFEER